MGIICDGSDRWSLVFNCDTEGNQETDPKKYYGHTKEIIDGTGYSWEELARMETAFMKKTNLNDYGRHFSDWAIKNIRKDQYKGLRAVVEILCALDGVSDVEGYREYFKTDGDLRPLKKMDL